MADSWDEHLINKISKSSKHAFTEEAVLLNKILCFVSAELGPLVFVHLGDVTFDVDCDGRIYVTPHTRTIIGIPGEILPPLGGGGGSSYYYV